MAALRREALWCGKQEGSCFYERLSKTGQDRAVDSLDTRVSLDNIHSRNRPTLSDEELLQTPQWSQLQTGMHCCLDEFRIVEGLLNLGVWTPALNY